MSAFSNYQFHSFPSDSVFFPTNLTKMPPFTDHPNINSNSFLPSFHPTPHFPIPETAFLSTVVVDDTQQSAFKKQTPDSSIVLDKTETAQQVVRKLTPMDKKRSNPEPDGSSLTCAQSQDAVKSRGRKQRKCSEGRKEAEKKEDQKAGEESAPKYVHVRARRGQATDSHSLAERIRREKISERMKILQTLVPGCDKVTGKALMLDEIINYVQSLQNQVEFLSMKLASVNPVVYDFGMDPIPYLSPCDTIQSTAVAPTTDSPLFTAGNGYIPLDDSSPFLLKQEQDQEQEQLGNISLDGVSLLLDAEEERQKFVNPSTPTGSLCNNSYFIHSLT